MSPSVIAIDGHAGAGKSTLADLIAERLNFWHVNTGLYYRAVTWLSLQNNVSPTDAEALTQLAHSAEIEVKESQQQQELWVNGQEVTEAVRIPEVNRLISQIASLAGVRNAITSRLQRLQHPKGIIMDGRDIGTVVFPHADLKLFLTASVEERARRQFADNAQKGIHLSLEELEEMIASRDQQDSERDVAPLCQAQDAILLDSTHQSVQSLAEQALSLWEKHARRKTELSSNA